MVFAASPVNPVGGIHLGVAAVFLELLAGAGAFTPRRPRMHKVCLLGLYRQVWQFPGKRFSFGAEGDEGKQ